MFDPLPGMLSGNNTGVGSATRPFTDIVLNGSGAPVGTIIAQGNNAQAGLGSLAGFSAVFRGNFVVTQAGSYTFNVGSADGFIFGRCWLDSRWRRRGLLYRPLDQQSY